MDYGRIFAQAWEYTKRFKALWLFGLLATCGTYHGGGGNFNFDLRPHGSEAAPPGLPPRLAHWLAQMHRFFRSLNDTQVILLAVALVAFAVGVALVMWALGRFGKAGVLRGAFSAAAGRETLTIGALAPEGLNFGARLMLADLVALVGLLVASLVLIPLLLVVGLLTLGIGAILLACLLLPAILIVKLYLHLVHVVLAAEPETGILEAYGRAWQQLTTHFGEWLIVGLLLGILGFVIGLALLIPATVLILGMVLAFMHQAVPIGLVLLGLTLLYFLLVWFVEGLLETFRLSAWALTYRELVPLPRGPEQGPAPAAPPEGTSPEENLPEPDNAA